MVASMLSQRPPLLIYYSHHYVSASTTIFGSSMNYTIPSNLVSLLRGGFYTFFFLLAQATLKQIYHKYCKYSKSIKVLLEYGPPVIPPCINVTKKLQDHKLNFSQWHDKYPTVIPEKKTSFLQKRSKTIFHITLGFAVRLIYAILLQN